MDELGQDARAILEAARHLDDPTSVDRARVRRSLFARVAAGGATVLATSGITLTATAKIMLPIGLVVAAAAGGGAWWHVHHGSGAGAPQAQGEPVAQVADPEAEPPSNAVQPTAPVQPPPVVRRRAAKAPAHGTTAGRLEQETALLTRVQAALGSDNPRTSLALLDEYDRRFPDGLLREEALATRVIARCQIAPGSESRQEALAFLKRHPSSPLASRVRESCGSDP